MWKIHTNKSILRKYGRHMAATAGRVCCRCARTRRCTSRWSRRSIGGTVCTSSSARGHWRPPPARRSQRSRWMLWAAEGPGVSRPASLQACASSSNCGASGLAEEPTLLTQAHVHDAPRSLLWMAALRFSGASRPTNAVGQLQDKDMFAAIGLLVEELYRVSPNTRPIFAAVGSDAAAVYTAQVGA